MTDRLGRLQREILESFFRRESRFFLTGGAALAGFYLGHRTTQDLDLFTTSEILDEGEAALRDVARELGAAVEAVRTSPSFRRRLVRRSDEAVIVDLVFDTAPQGDTEKRRQGVVVLDAPEEILANKLCALLSRAEIRDLVDVLFLERAGLRVEEALALAERKDGAMSAAQLAWILSQIEIAADARIPGDVSPADLQDFASDLERRLARVARPGGNPPR
ncbi:MAG: nucleotidyl transferase AbiEii/AbiGii toxin family protein [Candidatus Eiseniibacteriota bacterium]